MLKKVIFNFSFAVFVLIALLSTAVFAQSLNPEDLSAKKAELERELAELEREAEDLRGVITGYQKESATLERDISILNAQIKKAQLEIRAREIAIGNIAESIGDKNKKIDELLLSIERQKDSLSAILRRMNELDNTSLIETLLGGGDLSELFAELDETAAVKQAIHESIFLIRDTKSVTESEIDDLTVKRVEEIQLKSLQILGKQKIEEKESERKDILRITKGQEAEYQKVLAEKQKSAAEIRSQIFRLFGGGELSFGEAYDLARTAQKATETRAAFILAILTQESALDGVIGANVGRCFYNTPRNNLSGTVMKNDQKSAFFKITASLGFNPDSMPVSCPIAAHGAYGGAMGPAQFMPNTWLLYESDINEITGNNPPSPWSNADAFVATALYLKNSLDSSSCRNYASANKNILPYQFLLERCAAAQYYAGGNWHKFRFVYGDPVAERADQFQRDINVLNSLAKQ